MPTEEILKNLKKCPRFERCSANLCPLDFDAEFRKTLPEEDVCSFTVKKRKRGQKGIRTQAPDYILKVILESNLKMLNNRNQRRWHGLHKKDGR